MKCMWRFALAALIAVWVPGSSARGQDSPSAEEAPQEELTAWSSFSELEAPAEIAPDAWCDVILNREVFTRGRPDLADLRLVDGQGRFVPFALRFLSASTKYESLPAAEFNRAQGPEQSAELSLDLGPNPSEHNQVTLKLPREDYRRRVIIEGSDDGSSWSQLVDGYAVRFERADQKVEGDSLDYPASRFRYLKIRVYPDPVVDASETLSIQSADVRRKVPVPGESLRFEAQLGAREPTRVMGQPGSAWLIDLGGENVPCTELVFTIGDAAFLRSYELDRRTPPEAFEPFAYVTSGEWERRQGEIVRPIKIETGELQASQLRLQVQDVANPPLDIQKVEVLAPARQIVFRWPADASGPLRLYYGNPSAQSPQYDFARTLPAELPQTPERLTLGAIQKNPAFVPPPLPLTERWPKLIYFVLGAACLVLAGVIVSMGRQAIAIADSQTERNATSGP